MSYPTGHWDDLADFPATMPPGADSTNVPTQEFWTSDRKQAQLSQRRYKSASPSVSPFPQKIAPGTSRFASFRQTISTTAHV